MKQMQIGYILLYDKPAKLNQRAICKQFGSGWDAEYLGVSSGSKLFDTRQCVHKFWATLKHFEDWSIRNISHGWPRVNQIKYVYERLFMMIVLRMEI